MERSSGSWLTTALIRPRDNGGVPRAQRLPTSTCPPNPDPDPNLADRCGVAGDLVH